MVTNDRHGPVLAVAGVLVEATSVQGVQGEVHLPPQHLVLHRQAVHLVAPDEGVEEPLQEAPDGQHGAPLVPRAVPPLPGLAWRQGRLGRLPFNGGCMLLASPSSK